MPNIKPISDLRNYNEVLKYCENGEPVFLTKNGHGKYVILDTDEYERQQSVLKLLSSLFFEIWLSTNILIKYVYNNDMEVFFW